MEKKKKNKTPHHKIHLLKIWLPLKVKTMASYSQIFNITASGQLWSLMLFCLHQHSLLISWHLWQGWWFWTCTDVVAPEPSLVRPHSAARGLSSEENTMQRQTHEWSRGLFHPSSLLQRRTKRSGKAPVATPGFLTAIWPWASPAGEEEEPGQLQSSHQGNNWSQILFPPGKMEAAQQPVPLNHQKLLKTLLGNEGMVPRESRNGQGDTGSPEQLFPSISKSQIFSSHVKQAACHLPERTQLDQ